MYLNLFWLNSLTNHKAVPKIFKEISNRPILIQTCSFATITKSLWGNRQKYNRQKFNSCIFSKMGFLRYLLTKKSINILLKTSKKLLLICFYTNFLYTLTDIPQEYVYSVVFLYRTILANFLAYDLQCCLMSACLISRDGCVALGE